MTQKEECDLARFNGETAYPDPCTVACTRPHYCGDGILDTDRGEVCDPGVLNGGQACAADCTFVIMPDLGSNNRHLAGFGAR